MRRIVSLITLTFVSLMVLAQSQQGYVKTKGRLANNGTIIAGTRLSGATVSVKGGNAVLSGNNGSFSLSVPNNNYFLQNVQKQGYVLTDPDVLSKQYALSKNPLVLVLEDKNQQAVDRRAIERKISSSLYAQLQKRNDELEALKEQHKITEEKYRELLQKLNSDQDDNEKLISEMADRYSKMDFDEVDEFNRRISSLILEGKLTEADSLLNTKGDINSRAEAFRQHQEANVQAEQDIKKKQKKLEKSKLLAQKELEDLAQDCYSKFEIFKMQHQNDSAASYIKIRSELDTTNVEWQLNAGDFIRLYQASYDTSIQLYLLAARKSIQLYGEESDEYLKACSGLSCSFCDKAQYDDAQKWIEKAISIIDRINKGTNNVVADVYDSKSSLSYAIGEYQTALEFSQKSLEIKKQLHNDDTKKLTSCYLNIGAIYTEMGKYDLALESLKKALNTLSHDGEDKEETALVYNNMGMVYKYLKKFPIAIDCFEKAISLGSAVMGEKHPDIGMRYNNIGSIYDDMGKLDQAFDMYNYALKKLLAIYGELHPRIATILNNIASVHLKRNEFALALKLMTRVVSIEETVFGKYNSDVAISYANISAIYAANGEYSFAVEYANRAYLIFKEKLGEEHPNTKILRNKIEELKLKN